MKDSIIKFVKQTLGCQCPDEVFRHIECEKKVALDKDVLLNARINVGNRLLIYVIEAENFRFIKDNLSSWVNAGKKERDKKGFNRFRLVLTEGAADSQNADIYSLFNKLKTDDDKVHLHLIEKKDIPFN